MTVVRRWLDRTLRALCVVLFAVLVLLVVWQVFTRLVLDAPSAWSEEAARYTFVWVSLIGISIAIGEKADVVMDFVVEKLPVPWQRVVDVLAYLTVLAFASYVMIFGGIEQSRRAWEQTNPLLPLTQGQLSLALPISGALIIFYLVLHIAHALSRDFAGREGFHEDPKAATA
ncbi:TRAP transporter small permease [Modestobacter sp. VKM Ac-2986]|uniref:TRAP transporter small permease n=1 Tax=Modestobacter sp. VKM Ac-2986 TaxID=3004140 RepID=UPI0022AB02A5|nr:TRAP transporter small permease [Modestobacter sp. VKM Ac-2986]MCZ2827754.1 TRAP transporter small permease [Modestobacter sp. VKM Ac-2986]